LEQRLAIHLALQQITAHILNSIEIQKPLKIETS